MNRIALALLIAAFSSISGCSELPPASPAEAIRIFAAAIRENNVRVLSRLLINDARRDYASEDGVAELAPKLEGLDLLPGQSALTYTERDSGGVQRLREYHVEILGRPQADHDADYAKVLEATVTCSVDYVTNYCSGENLSLHPSDPSYAYDYCSRWFGEPALREIADCRVSEIKL